MYQELLDISTKPDLAIAGKKEQFFEKLRLTPYTRECHHLSNPFLHVCNLDLRILGSATALSATSRTRSFRLLTGNTSPYFQAKPASLL
jgi:hypothetical protein